jgi:hypothetical protein
MLDRSTILSQLNSAAASVDVPELGGTIGVRRVAFQDAMALAAAGAHVDESTAHQEQFLVELVVLCACDNTGKRLFRASDKNDVAKLPAMVLQRIADVALEINGLGAEAVEAATKNSDATHADAGS